MEDYKDMYFKLFNKMSDIVEEIKKVQQETEEMFLVVADNEAITDSDKQ